ncbi:transcription termination factor NusA [Patescibacteria group bacterium]|nr:transcription termination factor NusA [Patescibacteria group bacterium]
MNTILSAIEEICQEKKLSKEQVLEAIEQALASAYRKDFGNKLQNLKVVFEPESGQMKVFDEKTVVEDFDEKEKEQDTEDQEDKKRFNPKTEIQLSEARLVSPEGEANGGQAEKIKKKVKIGDVIKQKLEIPAEFGRIAAQTAKQVIVQRLREAEREGIYEKYKEQEGTIINGVVQRQERQFILIDLQDTTAILPLSEQIREERYHPDQKIKFYVLSVNKVTKGPEIILSRRHPEILKELFKLEIPEVANNTVEIKAIAREAGNRSKVAVWTKEESIDPIGACIGQRGVRIQTIINEIGGEKIDIIEYSEDPEKFIVNSLSPAKVASLTLNKKDNSALVKVKRGQLSLAIGRNGQNVRLAAKLSGWRIDIQEQAEEDEIKETKKVEEEKKEIKAKKIEKKTETKKEGANEKKELKKTVKKAKTEKKETKAKKIVKKK